LLESLILIGPMAPYVLETIFFWFVKKLMEHLLITLEMLVLVMKSNMLSLAPLQTLDQLVAQYFRLKH